MFLLSSVAVPVRVSPLVREMDASLRRKERSGETAFRERFVGRGASERARGVRPSFPAAAPNPVRPGGVRRGVAAFVASSAFR